ncbi:NAD(P)-dependent alcohol dehydrogenase [Marinomonas sp. IMCC 4694]|uniref:NAD(P)-dependent alcohol dehydrogenase n=1 Tax=Marinomonas sp. IMCC 4694 TaxID=2605432 RepID=UPI0011E84F11|nr:NAD(P)-dependent alcohol dehydrogenase [Marinomonas sp. IMCC 4694]TYL49321.1 NAD(P)-dependent alcohol dehydrogenase [Marinomonas sp. IMCC 4694]
MSHTKSYAALSATTPLVPFSFERRALREDDVNIDILYCGVCHSDIHVAESDWGPSTYPIVPGHEIVGRVTEIGSKVSKYKVGDIVGVGCMVDSCQHCTHCAADLEQYCDNGMVGTYGFNDLIDGTLTYGGYSDHIVVREKFVLSIPEALALSKAAPLLCAGITTYSPLRHHDIKAGDKVGILGMGGLGHMGVKFAKAFGAEVTIFTRSESKIAEAKKQGADHVIVSTDDAQMAAAAMTFDYLLDTIPVQHELTGYLNCLKVDGVHILVGLVEPMEPAPHTASLISKRRTITGSMIGGIAETQEMLDFCAEHNIECDAEMINIQDINQAYQRMKKGDVKYRFIIDMKSLKKDI